MRLSLVDKHMAFFLIHTPSPATLFTRDDAMDALKPKTERDEAHNDRPWQLENSHLTSSECGHATASTEDDCDLEEQPFLKAAEASENDAEQGRPGDKSFWTFRQALLFAILVIMALLSLSAVSLGFAPATTPKSQHDDDTEQHHHDTNPSQASEVVHYDEEMPATPTLRDQKEYILSSSWDSKAPPATREYHWTIVSGDLNPDGVYRPMVLINNQYPGPLVECNEGDTLVVHIDNKAPNATSIHFHGMFQNGTNHMDGTVGITQCAIAPNSSSTLRFQVKGQSGTYWYHAHHSAQASDGLLGPMIIHSPNERELQKLDYDSDRIVMVQDHYHNLTSELLMEYLAPDQENDEPVPDNALINGRGVRSCDDFEGWRCDNSSASTPVLDLAAGKRHRLRIINVGAFAEFQVQFDEHPFFVTEVDGTDVHPEPFHRLNILPAQRYSVVLETNVTTASAFWMRARMVTHCFTRPNKHLQPEIRAIVRYTSPEKEPTRDEPKSKDWPEAIEVICRDLNTSVLGPVVPIVPPPADDFIYLRANFEIGAWRLARGFFNESSFKGNATHPSLHRFLDSKPGDKMLKSPLGVNELVFDAQRELVLQTAGIRTIDISISNFDDGAHPFHMHGHHFFVLAQGSTGYPPAVEELPEFYNRTGALKNPLRRDTVTVEGYAWAILRVTLDNPGVWAFHCHNTWHAESGMLMQFLVRSDVMETWAVDSEHREMCIRKGVETGSRPDDSMWFGHF
ncbi:Cupredoxin [Thelonectria olida]|uniref:Cupredoxin n=1 Tax=Thelonectria olida TaxID=1576542 RepID=A0A9P9ARJ6_9HYPO|nr:Cupredoxin [Thelonectria olida]